MHGPRPPLVGGRRKNGLESAVIYLSTSLLTHRRKLWPLVWAFLYVSFATLGVSWSNAIILASVINSAYVILAYTLPWQPQREQLWYQFTVRELSFAMAFGGPILAAIVQLPCMWVDWHHDRLYEHRNVDFYLDVVNNAFFGVAGKRPYATSVSAAHLATHESLTIPQLLIEIETLQQLGASGKIQNLLFQMARDRDENIEIRLRALQALDAEFWMHPQIRNQVVGIALAITEESYLSTAQQSMAVALVGQLKSRQGAHAKILQHMARLAVGNRDPDMRKLACGVIASLPPERQGNSATVQMLQRMVRIAVVGSNLKTRQSARDVVSVLEPKVRSQESLAAITEPWIGLFDQPLTPERESVLFEILIVLEAANAAPRVASFSQLYDNVPDERQHARIDFIHTLISQHIRSNQAQTLVVDLAPLVSLVELNAYAEEKLANLITGAVQSRLVHEQDSLLELLNIMVTLSRDHAAGQHLLSQLRQLDNELAIRPLLELSVDCINSMLQQQIALTAVDLMDSHNVRDRETLSMLAKLMSAANIETWDRLCHRLKALRVKDRTFFIELATSESMQGQIQGIPVKGWQGPLDADNPAARRSLSSGLQRVFQDPHPGVQAYVRALVRSNEIAEDDFRFLAAWIHRQHETWDNYQLPFTQASHQPYVLAVADMKTAIADADASIQWFCQALFEPKNPQRTENAVMEASRLRSRLLNIERIRPRVRRLLLNMDEQKSADNDLTAMHIFHQHVLDWWYLQTLLPLYTEP